MFLKKIYNDLDTLVDESIAGGRLLSQPDSDKYSMLLPNSRITVRREKYRKPKGLVKLTGGGGAGHEGPPGGSFCRPGGMDAATTGDIFAAPSARQMLRAIEAIDDGSPILMGVANHAGDILNAKLCAQMALAKGIDVHLNIGYGNDVGSAPKGHEDERRGGGGLFNVTGIMAENGCSVDEIIKMSRHCSERCRSFGVGIRPAIHPITGLPIMGGMGEDEIELGIGVHGESSGRRMKLPRSRELARFVCDTLLEDMPIPRGEDIAVSLGGLGGMTWTELNILYKDIYEYLTYDLGYHIYRHSARNSGTQELGGFIFAIGVPDDEIRKWMATPIPDIYPKD